MSETTSYRAIGEEYPEGVCYVIDESGQLVPGDPPTTEEWEANERKKLDLYDKPDERDL